jgi:hypothetical protein
MPDNIPTEFYCRACDLKFLATEVHNPARPQCFECGGIMDPVDDWQPYRPHFDLHGASAHAAIHGGEFMPALPAVPAVPTYSEGCLLKRQAS